MKKEIYPSGQRVLYPEEGKIMATKDGNILGPVIWLGSNADENDFIEVDEPIDIEVE